MRRTLGWGVTVAIVLFSGAAAACPVGDDFTRPVVQGVSFQATQLLEQAADLEASAEALDVSARTADRQAEMFANRARILRNQATLVTVSDRGNVLAVASELSARARSERERAMADRAEASELRMQARSMRNRAAQLVRVNQGGGWRGKSVRDVAIDRAI